MVLTPADLTIITNASGIPTALGYPIHSALLQAGKPLLIGGKKSLDSTKGTKEDLGIPAGLLGTGTAVIISIDDEADACEDYKDAPTVPDSLYEKLMNLLEPIPTPPKKFTKRVRVKNNKTRKGKKL